MDISKEFLSNSFLSQLKTVEDVTSFRKEFCARVYEQMLEAEIDNHLVMKSTPIKVVIKAILEWEL